MSLWAPGEPAGLPVWLWGEARTALPRLCGCRWLMPTPVSSAASHLSGQGGQTGFDQETQVSRKTIKEIWIDQMHRPSRKQTWVQIFSELSSDKSSGHHVPVHPRGRICLCAATQKCCMKEQGCLLLSQGWWHPLEREAPWKDLPCPTALLGLWALAWIFGLLV